MPLNFQRRLRREDYTIAWLCALHEIELPAARCMLDEEHQPPTQPPSDRNTYKFGSINGHNIVIACLPAQMTGLASAAQMVAPLDSTFPELRVYLFVGIGGGIPHDPNELSDQDLHLGDVVIGWPHTGGQQAVVGWDNAAWKSLSGFRGPRDPLKAHGIPSWRALGTLTSLLSDIKQGNVNFEKNIRRLDLVPGFGRPSRSLDTLYKSDYECQADQAEGSLCRCSKTQEVTRKQREESKTGLVFHRGTILSGNSFMMDPKTRDQLKEFYPDALCFEMEAAGLGADINALIIRGICDYSDSHVNRLWQRYAAGTAAAFAREMIRRSPNDTENKAQAKAQYYPFLSIGLRPGFFLQGNETDVWGRMTVPGMAIYEQIHDACASDAIGKVQMGDFRLQFRPEDRELVDESWLGVSGGSTTLQHGMTLAAIYLVHMRLYGRVPKRLLEIPQDKEGKKRRAILRRFAIWVPCNCKSDQCPCLWNFANRFGLCRNSAVTCQACQFNNEPELLLDYGLEDFRELKRKWEGSYVQG